jgi:ankyrin repeat protein
MGQEEIVTVLLESGADCFAECGNEGYQAVHFASASGNTTILISILLDILNKK